MTDSELIERMEEAVQQITEAIEQRGALLEIDRKADFHWAGIARLPTGKLLIQTHKTGKQPDPEKQKPVLEAIADLTLEGRLLGRILFLSDKTEVELPGGAHRALDHSGVAKIFNAM
jgi:hypothetical protein